MPKIIDKMPGQSLVSAKWSITLGSPLLSSKSPFCLRRISGLLGSLRLAQGKGEVPVFKHTPLGMVQGRQAMSLCLAVK